MPKLENAALWVEKEKGSNRIHPFTLTEKLFSEWEFVRFDAPKPNAEGKLDTDARLGVVFKIDGKEKRVPSFTVRNMLVVPKTGFKPTKPLGPASKKGLAAKCYENVANDPTQYGWSHEKFKDDYEGMPDKFKVVGAFIDVDDDGVVLSGLKNYKYYQLFLKEWRGDDVAKASQWPRRDEFEDWLTDNNKGDMELLGRFKGKGLKDPRVWKWTLLVQDV